MTNKDEVKIAVNKFIEIIYEQYIEDIKDGKLNDNVSRDKKQAVGKSATKSKTFHQPALEFK
jgi:hypothetical protein